MAIEVSTFPKTSNVSSYSVTEDAVSLVPGDLGAGTGSVQVTGDAFTDDVFTFGTGLSLTDDRRGSTVGTINDVNPTDGTITLSASNILGKFDVNRTMLPVPLYSSTNYFINPKPNSNAYWTPNFQGGSGTNTYNASGAGAPLNLPQSYVRIQWAVGAGLKGVNLTSGVTASLPIGTYTVTVWVRTGLPQYVQLGATGGTATYTTVSAPTTITSGVSSWDSVTATVNVTVAGTVSVVLVTPVGAHLWAAGETLDIRGGTFVPATSTFTGYFDGDDPVFGSGYATDWTGAANNSSSTLHSGFGPHFEYWCAQVGITQATMSADIYTRPAVYPGWTGNIWDMIKNCLVAEQLELYVVGSTVGVREIRSTTVTPSNSTTFGEHVTSSSAAKAVEIIYYSNTGVTQKEVYPVDNEEPTVYQVNQNETVEFDIQLKTSLSSVNQPICLDWVEADPNYYDGTVGAYAITKNDNTPYPAAQWNAYGGSITVTLTSDPTVIHVVIVGPNDPYYSPYRVGMYGDDIYSALRITGSGVQFAPTTLTFPTGVDPTVAADDIGETVDNIFISSLSQAINIGSRTASAYEGVDQSIDVTTGDVDLDFGIVPGARIIQPGANFRASSVTYGPGNISITGVADTTLGDLTGVWAPADTLGQLQTSWSGKTLKEFMLRPLRRV